MSQWQGYQQGTLWAGQAGNVVKCVFQYTATGAEASGDTIVFGYGLSNGQGAIPLFCTLLSSLLFSSVADTGLTCAVGYSCAGGQDAVGNTQAVGASGTVNGVALTNATYFNAATSEAAGGRLAAAANNPPITLQCDAFPLVTLGGAGLHTGQVLTLVVEWKYDGTP